MALTVRHAAGAILLRRLALRILAGGDEDARQAWAQAATLPGPTWRLFLRVERCAGPLARRLQELGLAPAPDSLLTMGLLEDTRRTLAARDLIAIIARAAESMGSPAVLLKGARAVEQGHTFFLMDVDVLTKPAAATALADAAGRVMGVERQGEPSIRHLGPVAAQTGLPLEVHTNIDNRRVALGGEVWRNVRPGAPGLAYLGPVDHALHILVHMTMDHPERRGRIRDTLLLGLALDDLAPADRQELDRRASRTPYADILRAQLGFADALRSRTAGGDPFEIAVFTRYWMVERNDKGALRKIGLVRSILPSVGESVAAILSGWSMIAGWVDGLREATPAPSELALTRKLEQLSPGVGRAARVGFRVAHYLAAYATGAVISPFVRADARRAGVSV